MDAEKMGIGCMLPEDGKKSCCLGGSDSATDMDGRCKTGKPQICTTKVRGVDILRDPHLNKGRAFTLMERQVLGIHGLLPPAVVSQDDQVALAMENFDKCCSDLDRYVFLVGLLDSNVKLFYRVIGDNISKCMPIVYTPVVGLACQKFGFIYRHPQGLYLTINDAGHLYEMLSNWPHADVKAICVTDGERILGLGDLGAYGMGIPVGKLALYTACAGVQPRHCLPITIDVGTNTESLLADKLYTGLKHKRVTGPKYEAFLDEFMKSVVRRFGQNTLIQFEDFGNHNAFVLLEKYRDKYCTFNDDIQGTASVALSGLIASMRIIGKRLSESSFLFQGAGEAALGIAQLLVTAMEVEGTSRAQAVDRIWMVDSKGLIVKDRPTGGLTKMKLLFARDHAPIDTLEEVVATIKPTAIIGVAAIGGAFTKTILENMAKFNDRPVIFAMSNPTSKAECTAIDAFTITKGRCIFASGSPFDPVTIDGTTYFTGQGNNAYIFPGLGLAIILCAARHVPDGVFLHAANVLASLVDKETLDTGLVYPPLADIREVSVKVAIKLVEYMYKEKIATHYPEPADKDSFVRSQLFCSEYESFVPDTYAWPTM